METGQVIRLDNVRYQSAPTKRAFSLTKPLRESPIAIVSRGLLVAGRCGYEWVGITEPSLGQKLGRH